MEKVVSQINESAVMETGKQPKQILADELAKPKVGGVPEIPKIETQQIGTTPEIVPKTTEPIKVSRSQLPVGEGELKTTGLEARIKSNLESAPEEIKASLSTYNEMNNKEQIKKAVDYVSKNPDDALSVLRGDKPAPKGILNNSIYVAMSQEAETNSELGAKLASLRSTRYGQEIEILKEINKDNPVKYMTDLVNARVEALGGRDSLTSLRNQEMGGIKKAISLNRLVKTDWNAFIDSITC